MTLTSTRSTDVIDWINELESTRTMRMQRHLTVATLAVATLAIAGPNPGSLLGLILISALVAVAVSSLARGADAKFGYLWGWIYSEPSHKTWLDRLVHLLLQRLVVHPRRDEPAEGKVRIIDDAEFAEALRKQQTTRGTRS